MPLALVLAPLLEMGGIAGGIAALVIAALAALRGYMLLRAAWSMGFR